MNESKSAPGSPDKRTVVARMLCMGSLVLRSILEWQIQSHSDPNCVQAYRTQAERLSRWLAEQEFATQFTREETQAQSQAPGSWGIGQMDEQRHYSEALGTLFWALSIYREIPPYLQPFETPNLGILLGWPTGASANPFDKGLEKFPRLESAWLKQVANLRPASILMARRNTAECWLWRVNAATLQHGNVPPPPGQTYEELIAIAAQEAFRVSAIDQPVEGDFPVQGRPFRELADREIGMIGTNAKARWITLNWLCGYLTEWDDKENGS